MERARTGRMVGPLEVIDHVDRRQFLRGAVVGGLTLVIATASKALSGPSVDTLASAPQPRTTTHRADRAVDAIHRWSWRCAVRARSHDHHARPTADR